MNTTTQTPANLITLDDRTAVATAVPASTLVKSQTRTLPARRFTSGQWEGSSLTPTVRWDDQCGNGRNTFSITADIRSAMGRDEAGGCLHAEVAELFPELAHLVCWHLCSSDGPMHYLANTLHHALSHGPKMAHVYFRDPANDIGHTRIKYCSIPEAEAMVAANPLYSFVTDEKTAKEANFAHARSTAVWPEATDEQLSLPPDELRALLIARLPALMEEMHRDITAFGFAW